MVLNAPAQMQFADHYFNASQWEPAVSEYTRLIHFFPNAPQVALARYRMGVALFQQQQIERALDQFQQVVAFTGAPTDLIFKALLQIGACTAQLQSPQAGAEYLRQVAGTTDDPEIKAEALYRAGWLLLDAQDPHPAGDYFREIAASQRSRLDIDALLTELSQADALPQKNPALSGGLALVPGVGYLYLGRYQDAWISLLAVGGLGWAAYEAFDNESPVLGSLLGVTGAGFYLGSIHGSVTSARRANQRETRRFIDGLRQKYKIQISFHPPQTEMGLILSGRF
ncbi:MAG: tetratricopeptide repeat protein [Desulfobacterales bacterium]